MAQLSGKKVIIFFLFFCVFVLAKAQEESEIYRPKDYKDRAQFEKFRKRRMIIAAWQINQLKEGAIVVRLKTNQKLIEALRKQGNESLAIEKEAEQFAIDKNTLDAYRKQLTFCKVYFMYSYSSDSLLQGAKTGIFLDSNLIVDPLITMNEKFYLIAERDYAYNSSIGFVKEDSAKFVSEHGNPVKEMAVVVKNKYSHQLKAPFPYYVKDKTYAGANADVTEKIIFNGSIKEVLIGKQFSKEKLALYIGILNDNLIQFHQSTPKPELDKLDPSILPFLY
ncbi:MAG: hypothetical protein Q7W45_12520 [Bacteroidota bacterium]|nr:hypothetical protein [Bacteroidota bacterium]MDP3146847.1 hypothetical protein [Bacteroidota bacterium]